MDTPKKSAFSPVKSNYKKEKSMEVDVTSVVDLDVPEHSNDINNQL